MRLKCLATAHLAASVAISGSNVSAQAQSGMAPQPNIEHQHDSARLEQPIVGRESNLRRPAAYKNSKEPSAAQTESVSLPKALTIASWGGAYQRSQEIAYIEPYTRKTGISVRMVAFGQNVDMPSNDGEVLSWDVADLPVHVADRACKAGLLEVIDASMLAPTPDGRDAVDDFLPGGLGRCAVASVAWSSVTIVNAAHFKKTKPSELEHVFDTKRFKGKRAFPKNPRYVLEMALMADGVSPNLVYAELSRPEGVKRALDKLETIRSDIVWWKHPHEPFKLLADGKATIAMAFSGRAFDVMARRTGQLDTIWDGQIFDLDVWVISKAARNKQAAKNFVNFATTPERLAEQARWLPYGPMRQSAISLVGRHAALGIEMSSHLPTAPRNRRRALQIDNQFWAKNEATLNQTFSDRLYRGAPEAITKKRKSEVAKELKSRDKPN